ncbi:hypothetical protein BDV12DRAFT_181082 [Aspergillus spectabilis]
MSDNKDQCKTNPKAKAIMKSLKQDPTGEGFTHLATDGVLRSFDGDRNVLDYKPLSPEEIALVLEEWPPTLHNQLREMFKGVDGRNVKNVEQFIHPHPDLMPPEPTSSGDQAENIANGNAGE